MSLMNKLPIPEGEEYPAELPPPVYEEGEEEEEEEKP